MSNWKDYTAVSKPVDHGYYYTKYYNFNEFGIRYKALWWNGAFFAAPRQNFGLGQVYAWLDERFDYYVPCQMNGNETPLPT
jgi:hypothetical protein